MPHISIPENPFRPVSALAPDPALLDSFAEAYTRERSGKPLEMMRFLFGFLPIRLFDNLLDPGAPEARPGDGSPWLMFLSGYFGGVWLRAELVRAQPDGLFASHKAPPNPEALEPIAARVSEGIDAARGEGAEALVYTERCFPDLVKNFGYNLGYMLEILERPPQGLSASKDMVRAGGLLWAEYENPRLSALEGLRDSAKRLSSASDAGWRELAEPLPASQEAELARGRQVWSSGISVQGFGPEAYAQLLDVSASFLEVVQAVALTAATALAENDIPAARRTAQANALLAPWLGTYSLGLMDGSREGGEILLPSFDGSD